MKWRPWVRTNGLITLTAAWFTLGVWTHRWIHEDGLINVRVVQNLLAGHGPVYNVGERVEAYTSPVLVGLLAVLRLLTFNQISVEGLMFLVGVVAGTTGLVLVMRAVVILRGLDSGERWVFPLGGLVFAAVPLTWDFATSGHEGALGYLWIGVVFWGFALRIRLRQLGASEPPSRPHWLFVVLGAGVLVRPELGLFTVAILGWWLYQRRHSPLRQRLAVLAWALALPLAYQVFRMGYFGLLLPMTAQSKLGGHFGASRGLHYVWDFVAPFALLVPLAVVTVATVVVLTRSDRTIRGFLLTWLVPSLLLVAYVVQIGGDYINGRMLVLPFLGLLAPVAAVELPALRGADDRAAVGWRVAVVVVACWVPLASLTLRPPSAVGQADLLSPRFDERAFFTRLLGHVPRSAADYRGAFLTTPVDELVQIRAAGLTNALDLLDFYRPAWIQLPKGHGYWVSTTAIGATGVLLGPQVHVIDQVGLADPLASHFPVIAFAQPGHLHQMTAPWVKAEAGVADDAASRQALHALHCGQLAGLLRSSQADLSAGRFVNNFFGSFSRSVLAIPDDPAAAVRKFCG